MQQFRLFESGQGPYHTYRIPSLVITQQGTLLAFCEGRKDGPHDWGDVALLSRRSDDQGKTWSAPQVVWDDLGHTCGNPCPVLDHSTGIIWLLMTWNRGDDPESKIIAQTSQDTRRVFVSYSADDGLTWQTPKEITQAVKKAEWTWYATGPGAGIQLRGGPYQDRLVIPCDHIEAGTEARYSHIIYSDDHGQSWHLGGRTPEADVNECEVVELADHRLLLNMRNYDRQQSSRKLSFSEDGGLSWGKLQADPALVEPICQASIRRYEELPANKSGLDRLLFSNPAHKEARQNMTLRLSEDGGQSWPYQQVLHPGPSAYSCLAVSEGGQIYCLYEGGQDNYRESIILAKCDLAWLKGQTT